MHKILLVLLYSLSFYIVQGQVRKWHADKKVTVFYTPVSKPQNGHPIIDTINFSVICFNYDKSRISIYFKDSIENYDCYDIRVKTLPSHVNKKEIVMQAVDDYGNHCKINFQIGEDNTQFKGYDGMFQVLYVNMAYMYYLTDPE